MIIGPPITKVAEVGKVVKGNLARKEEVMMSSI
jgi:hypothetical protein